MLISMLVYLKYHSLKYKIYGNDSSIMFVILFFFFQRLILD